MLRNRILAALTLLTLVHLALYFTNAFGQESVERWHAQGVFWLLSRVLGSVSSAVPFSLSEVFLVVFGVVGLIALWQSLRWLFRREGSLSCLRPFAWLALAFVWLYFCSYAWLLKRPTIGERLGLEKQHSAAAVRAAAERCAIATKRARVEAPQRDFARTSTLAAEALRAVLPKLGGGKLVQHRLKAPWPTGLLAIFGTTGVFSPLFHEAHVDPAVPDLWIGFTAAHEFAHCAGIGFEDEANFVAWVACLASPDPYLRYQGHIRALSSFEANVGPATRAKLRKLAGPEVRADRARALEAWRGKRDKRLARIQRIVYDRVLKTQGVKEGVRSYSNMVRWIVAWEEQAKAKTKEKR